MNRVSESELIDSARGERVTLAAVEAAIISEHFFTAMQGARTELLDTALLTGVVPDLPLPLAPDLGLLTICVLRLWNGFTVLGQSACADPKNFNPDIGRRLAKSDAVGKMWALMGYELKSRMARDERLVGAALVDPQEGFSTYIGTKVINATPMNRERYNWLRGWSVPKEEDPDTEGYMVEYTDRVENPPHVPGFKGYVSWSPKEVFERAYRPVRVAEAQPTAASAEGSGTASSGEKKKEETWVDRLMIEVSQISERYEKLNTFVLTDAFHRLPKVERQDLYVQLSHMEGYKHAVQRRLARHQLSISDDGRRQAQQFQNKSTE